MATGVLCPLFNKIPLFIEKKVPSDTDLYRKEAMQYFFMVQQDLILIPWIT